MALGVHSVFYYDYRITSDNQNVDFSEGGPEIQGQIKVGSYTFTDMLTALQTAFNDVGGQTYTVTGNRDTRKITISAPGTFELLTSTGSRVGTSPWSILGFSSVSDKTGASSYEGEDASGDIYFPQFWLQDYVDPTNTEERIQPSVNESASGVVEVISFGSKQKVEMSIMFITDLPQDGKLIKNNVSGVADANRFMSYLVTRSPLEFMPDESDTSTFFKIQLEKTPESSKGVAYVLKEETGKNLPGIYKTGKLVFRVVE